MEKFNVIGMVFSHVGKIEVEAENYKEAMEKARQEILKDDKREQALMLPVPEGTYNLYTVMAEDVDISDGGTPAMDEYFEEIKKANEAVKDDKTDNAS